jgi:hypothetical protein
VWGAQKLPRRGIEITGHVIRLSCVTARHFTATRRIEEWIMHTRFSGRSAVRLLSLALLAAFGLAAAVPAHADDGRRRDREHHDHWRRGGGWDVGVYAAPPVVYAPPAAYYAPPPVYYAPPAVSLGFRFGR